MFSNKKRVDKLEADLRDHKKYVDGKINSAFNLINTLTDLVEAISRRVDDSKDYEELEKRIFECELKLDQIKEEES